MSYSEILKKLRTLEYELNEIIEAIEEKDEEIKEIGEQPEELYNGKVVCIDSRSSCFTKGKIYEFKDGITLDDEGDCTDLYRDFEHFNNDYCSEFIQVTEEEEAEWGTYNGKVICIEAFSREYTKGKIYELKNGIVIDDDGDCIGIYKNFEDFSMRHCSKFIEIVGDEENE